VKKPSANPQPVDAAITPRFSAIPTFMRLPYLTEPTKVDIALIGVPWDGGTTNRAGARHGPREIRNMSSFMRKVHHVSRIAPYDLARIADLATPRSIRSTSWIRWAASSASIRRCMRRGAAALGRRRPSDHAADLPRHRQGPPHRHGPFRRPLRHQRPLFRRQQIHPRHALPARNRGGRARSQAHDPDRHPRSTYNVGDMEFAEKAGIRVVYMEEFTKLGVAKTIKEARRVAGKGPTYVSFDVDGLDPVYAPGTGTPEIGGLTTLEAQHILRGLQGLDLVGGDVVEVSPPFDPSGNTALVGATSCSRSCACWPMRWRAAARATAGQVKRGDASITGVSPRRKAGVHIPEACVYGPRLSPG